MLKKLYDKSNILFAILWIVAYCVLMSLGDALSAMVGVEKSVTVVVGFLLSAVLWLFLKKNGLLESYGFCAPRASARTMLYYLPVLAMLTANFWFGVAWNYGIVEIVLYVLAMLCVGFLEEVLFRGLLFEAMRKDNLKAAVIVSAVTFGIGHIINLINGSGVKLLPNLHHACRPHRQRLPPQRRATTVATHRLQRRCNGARRDLPPLGHRTRQEYLH